MSNTFKSFLFTVTFNLSLFLVLIIGIQNSKSSKKINLIINETVKLPVGFIVGVSFISGSIAGSLITINQTRNKTHTSERY
tara:strand:+ start:87 stop:329 length:243 start_codon:yes stop_codon:yes gene_type:complete